MQQHGEDRGWVAKTWTIHTKGSRHIFPGRANKKQLLISRVIGCFIIYIKKKESGHMRLRTNKRQSGGQWAKAIPPRKKVVSDVSDENGGEHKQQKRPRQKPMTHIKTSLK